VVNPRILPRLARHLYASARSALPRRRRVSRAGRWDRRGWPSPSRLTGLGAQGELRHHDQALPSPVIAAERRARALMAREGWTASEQALRGPAGLSSRCWCGRPTSRAPGTWPPWKISPPGGGEALSLVRVHDTPSSTARASSASATGPPDDIREVTGSSTPPCRTSSSTTTAHRLEAKFSASTRRRALVEETPRHPDFTDAKVQDPAIPRPHVAG
jgi:hypothetical protein